MFGSHWDKAEATIVAGLPKYSGDGSASWEFVADVRPADGGPAFRATLKEPTIAIDFWRPSIGDVVSVLVKSNGKVKFDKDDPRISVKAYEAGRKQAFEAARGQEFGSPTGGGLPGGGGDLNDVMAQFGRLGIQPGGAQVFTVGGADPERMRAAADKLRAAGLGGLADQLENQPAQSGQPAQPGQSAGSAPSGDPAARLSTLANLRDQGLLSAEEYAAQRQRILDQL